MSDDPHHSPPPSAHAPKPRGILKNPLDRRPSQAESAASTVAAGGARSLGEGQADQGQSPLGTHNLLSNGLSWDEQNIALHDFEKENTQRMKIDEPKTPYVRGAGIDEEGVDSLDLNQNSPTASSASYFPQGSSSSSSGGPAHSQLLANTSANAGPKGSSDTQGGVTTAVGLDSADLSARGATDSRPDSSNTISVPSSHAARADKRGQSRSPSFSLVSSGSSSRRASSRSLAGDDSRSGVRSEVAHQAMDVDGQDEASRSEAVSEDEDEETRAQRQAFAKKRNAHYGQEALIAKALASKDIDDDDDDDDENASSAAPPLVNGS